jgi:hypothetical protein
MSILEKALILQGTADTLFTFDEAIRNYLAAAPPPADAEAALPFHGPSPDARVVGG